MLDDILDSVAGTPGRLLGIGLALGAGVMIGRGLRPVAKTLIRGFMTVAESVKEASAEAGESLQDLYAEAKAEHDQAAGPQPANTGS
jgi:hypothetical protein